VLSKISPSETALHGNAHGNIHTPDLIRDPSTMPAIRGAKSKRKTRRYTRDADQIHADTHDPAHLRRYHDTKATEDLPGLGQWYCVECARWFEAEANLISHQKSKPHKRMYVMHLIP